MGDNRSSEIRRFHLFEGEMIPVHTCAEWETGRAQTRREAHRVGWDLNNRQFSGRIAHKESSHREALAEGTTLSLTEGGAAQSTQFSVRRVPHRIYQVSRYNKNGTSTRYDHQPVAVSKVKEHDEAGATNFQ